MEEESWLDNTEYGLAAGIAEAENRLFMVADRDDLDGQSYDDLLFAIQVLHDAGTWLNQHKVIHARFKNYHKASRN